MSGRLVIFGSFRNKYQTFSSLIDKVNPQKDDVLVFIGDYLYTFDPFNLERIQDLHRNFSCRFLGNPVEMESSASLVEQRYNYELTKIIQKMPGFLELPDNFYRYIKNSTTVDEYVIASRLKLLHNYPSAGQQVINTIKYNEKAREALKPEYKYIMEGYNNHETVANLTLFPWSWDTMTAYLPYTDEIVNAYI